jgi:DNA (cytosine-5)-methyltransferase 1
MTKDMLIRSIDPEVADWIETTKPAGVSREEYLRQVISAERRRIENPQATLFPVGADPERVYGKVPFRFIDLFAGIGGFRCGLTKVGGNCVYTSEWDKYAATTYESWYGERPVLRDIRDIDYANKIPDHDVLAAGFPCQPFSLAGVSKKNSLGRLHGFEDEKQGNLFFSILDVIAAKQPPVLLLENVKNLKSHDKGNTWEVIRTSLEDCGYRVFHKIIDASGWVPQHRERIFIVGFRKEVFDSSTASGFEFPRQPEVGPLFGSILEADPDRKYMLSDKLWQYLQDYKDKHARRGNGFGYGIADRSGVSRTMSARYHKDGSEILIRQKGWRNPRRLTPREAARLLGFDDRYSTLFGHGDEFPQQIVSDTQAYRQFGNAVVPKVVEAVAEQIVRVMAEAVERTDNGCLLKGRLAMEAAA